jgi:hypothetical protein
MNVKMLLWMGFLVVAMITATGARAATYYVDYANGNDSNNGISKTTPWKHAPGMNGCTANCSITPNAGDKIILKGCVTWPNAAFSWTPPSNGSSGNLVYYGVDQTWWDSTVSGCSSAWNRPVFNLGGAVPSDSLYRIIILSHSYMTLDNFEITGMLNAGSPGNGGTDVFDWGDGSESGVHVQNMYVHGVVNKYFSIGTGNLSNGSSTITNYVPLSYSPSASGAFLAGGTAGLPCTTGGCNGGIQLQGPDGGIPLGNSTPTVTSITGSNPYTITFTNTSGGANENCTGCLIQLGNDFLSVTGGINGATNDDIMQDNVIDFSDNAEWRMNPYEDCGLTESNNNLCIGTGTVDWRLPNIWRNNVIRNVASVAVAECTEWSGNLIEYIRLSINPTAHTNVIECVGTDHAVNGATAFYNNVIRHTNNPNPNTPTGRTSVGLGDIQAVPGSGETAYIFNNVMYDTLQNAVIERGNGSGGTMVVFNNSGDCGPSWELTHVYSNPLVAGDVYYNNYCATSNSTPLSCSGLTCAANLFPTPSAANAAGYTESETYAYSPPSSSSPTVSATATSMSPICATISSENATAGAACANDTTYAVNYDSATHAVTGPARTTVSRGSTPNIGAYQFSAGSADSSGTTAPAAPSDLTATVN